MFISIRDLQTAVAALRYKSIASRRVEEEQLRYSGAAWDVFAVVKTLREDNPESEDLVNLSREEDIAILACQRSCMLIALDEYFTNWAKLARVVSAKRGKLPEQHLQESGNAYEVASSLRDTRDYLHHMLPKPLSTTQLSSK